MSSIQIRNNPGSFTATLEGWRRKATGEFANPCASETTHEPTKWVAVLMQRSEPASRRELQFVFAACRHPLRGFTWFDLALPTGSRTHPWLYAVIPSGFGLQRLTCTRFL